MADYIKHRKYQQICNNISMLAYLNITIVMNDVPAVPQASVAVDGFRIQQESIQQHNCTIRPTNVKYIHALSCLSLYNYNKQFCLIIRAAHCNIPS